MIDFIKDSGQQYLTGIRDYRRLCQNFKMQLSTSRMNFTTSSVAQFNYVQFVNKFRSSRKNFQDIVTVLGLHTDDIQILNLEELKEKRVRHNLVSKREKRNLDLVLYRVKKMTFQIRKTALWFRIAFIAINQPGYSFKIIYDLKMASIVTEVFIVNNDRGTLYTIKSGDLCCSLLKLPLIYGTF